MNFNQNLLYKDNVLVAIAWEINLYLPNEEL